jgi:hypothetical protein
MDGINFIKIAGIDILKGAAAAVASFVGLILGSRLTSMLGLPAVVVPAYLNMAIVLPLMLLTSVLIAILLGECFQRLYASYWLRLGAVFLCHYLLYYALNTLDGLLFTPLPNMSTSFVSNLVNTLLFAACVAWLWKPRAGSLPEQSGAEYTPGRKPLEWIWRLGLAWLVFPPIYYLAGRVVGIFTQHYYQDPSLNLGLTLPTIGILMAMQVLRGALFLLAVLPLVLAWKGTSKGLWMWVGSVIFLQIAAQVMFQAYWLPIGLRFPHTLELLADSFIQAGAYVWLMYAYRSTTTMLPNTPQELKKARVAAN